MRVEFFCSLYFLLLLAFGEIVFGVGGLIWGDMQLGGWGGACFVEMVRRERSMRGELGQF